MKYIVDTFSKQKELFKLKKIYVTVHSLAFREQ